MNNKKLTATLASLMIFLIVTSCGEDTKIKIDPENRVESMNKGELTLYSDISTKHVMDSVYKMYETTFPDVDLTVEYVNARKAMAEVLGGEARIAVISRDYLEDEDSTMKDYEVTREKMEIAKDGLVFFTQTDFELDTLNVNQIETILTDSKTGFKDYFPSLESEPEIAVAEQNSAVYAHLQNLAAKGKKITRKLRMFATTDSVKQYVLENPNVIGVAYLSHIVRDPDYKALRLGFFHESGIREMPQTVHQSFIVMERYPYIVTYYAYLLEDRRNLPWWVGTFLSKETKVQQYFNEFGIVPGYAKIKLIKRG